MAKVSRTQVVKFIRGGERGPVLRGPQAWSDCAAGYTFQAGGTGDDWKDVVLYNGNYYSCKKSHAKTGSNYPGSTAATNNGLWQLCDAIELVATKILLATYALVENLGVTAIDMKDNNGNVIFKAKDGVVTCKTGNFENVNIEGIVHSSLFYGKTKIITSQYYTINPAAEPYNTYIINDPTQRNFITLPKASDYDGLELSFFIKNDNWRYDINTTHIRAASGDTMCCKRNIYNYVISAATFKTLEFFNQTYKEDTYNYWMMQPNMLIRFKSMIGKWYCTQGLWTGE